MSSKKVTSGASSVEKAKSTDDNVVFMKAMRSLEFDVIKKEHEEAIKKK